MAVKYYISFTSDLGKNCRVDFDIAGYGGQPIELDGSGCSILYDGKDMFDPIITSKASLSVNYHDQFLRDTRDADDKQIPVTIYHGNEKWIGFLIADNRDETFDKTNQTIDLVCVDPFSYIRTLQKDMFRDIEMYGRQSIETVIRSIFGYVLDSLSINVLNDTVPNGATGNIINATYCYTQVFQDDNGIFQNGYDIIESLMNDLIMTAIFYNGVLVLRNNKYLMNQDGLEIGLSEDGDANFWIGNSELVTRTRGQKEASRSLDYPDPITLLTNPYFYYYNASKADKVRGWNERPSFPWEGVTGVEYIGTGRDRSPYGYRISGLFAAGAGEGKDVGAVWTIAAIQMPIGGLILGDQHNYLLKIKFRYSRYPIVLNDDGDQRKIQLAVTVVARDLAGTKTLFYNNNGKTGLGEYSIDQWDEFISTSNNDPRVYFPIENTNEIQDVEVSIPDVANYGLTGPVQYEVYLFPVSDANGNAAIITDGGGWSAYPDSIDYLAVDFMLVRDGKAYYNGNAYIDKYTNEQSFYTSKKNFSQIGETKNMSIGRSYFLAGRDSNGDDVNVLDAFNRASLTYSDGEIISVFNQGATSRPLIQLAAASELFFNRLPRYQIDAVIRGNVNITDILISPKVIEGKYVCVKDEYDLYTDEHNMTLQQLSGSDDETDIIENFLSTN